MMNMPRFNFMWIYAMFGIFIVTWWILGDDRSQPIEGDWTMVEEMVSAGDVEQIRVDYVSAQSGEVIETADSGSLGSAY
jgi:hypothetical protein